jgi:predicted NAD/FAD-dependent oxidoreductase
MAAFPRALGTAFDAVEVASGPLAGATRNTSKPGRPPGEAWVLHADPAWSRHHVDDEPGSVGEALVAAFFTATGIPAVAPLHVAVHRWLLARAERPLDAGACWDARARVGVAGDWCHGGDVEGAARSAWSLVGQVQGGS